MKQAQRTSVWIVEILGRRGWIPVIIHCYGRRDFARLEARKYANARVRRYDRVDQRTKKGRP